MSKKAIYLCQPSYGQPNSASKRQFWVRSLQSGGPYSGYQLVCDDKGTSLLANAFNYHWANALNNQLSGVPITYFAMLHDDVIPEDWWLDKLLQELEETEADVLSVVTPIKDQRGLTSVAISDPDNEWEVLRRLTMSEVYSLALSLPETFGIEDCGYDPHFGYKLLVNTGCWACRFDKPWRCEEDLEGNLKVFFTIRDRICRMTDRTPGVKPEQIGMYNAWVMPEDWYFSRAVAELGCKVLATRKVKLTHVGAVPYPNSYGWGEYQIDEDLQHKFNKEPLPASLGKELKSNTRRKEYSYNELWNGVTGNATSVKPAEPSKPVKHMGTYTAPVYPISEEDL